MKQFLFISMILLALGCKKRKEGEKALEQIEGTWKLQEKYIVMKGYTLGNGEILHFNNCNYKDLKKHHKQCTALYTTSASVQEPFQYSLGAGNSYRFYTEDQSSEIYQLTQHDWYLAEGSTHDRLLLEFRYSRIDSDKLTLLRIQ